MNYGERQLQSLIKSKEYERLPEDTKNKLIEDKKLDIKETITDPIIIPNPNNIDVYKEKVLHNLIYENLDNFLKKLGSDYYYVGREYKIKIGDTYHRIDFLLFNMEYDAYIVIELKIGDLKKEHIGQIETYMNYIDKNNKLLMEYCSNPNIITREYILT